MPIFNGLYRSLTSIAHPFTLSSFTRLAQSINTLIVPKTIERLNQLLLNPSSLFPPRTQTETDDDEEDSTRSSLPYAYALLSKYRLNDRPLSGNLLICAGLEMQFTMLAQILVPAEMIRTKVVPLGNDSGEGAEASNAAWAVLLSGAAEGLEGGEAEGKDKEALTEIMGTALRSFADMSSTIQTLRSEPSVDLYPYEVVSESLVSLFVHSQGWYSKWC